MTIEEMFSLVRWDWKLNQGASLDVVRARTLLLELRLEQFVYRWIQNKAMYWRRPIWFLVRGFGSVLQWFFCSSSIPGSVSIGRGLRLPHPQNIIIAAHAGIGEFCIIYQNVSIARNGFNDGRMPHAPRLGDRVLIGASSVVIGDITVGSDVLIGAGTTVVHSVPAFSRVTSSPAVVVPRFPSDSAVEPGSDQHLKDPYAIWR